METGTQQICDTNGDTIDVTAYDYKSTIVEQEDIKKIMQNPETNTYYWYRNNDFIRYYDYSIATDNLDKNATTPNTREYYYANKKKTVNDKEEYIKEYSIYADTPQFDIEIENNAQNGYGECKKGVTPPKTTIKNISFGIITNPKIKLQLEKTIVNIKVTNTQGQKIIEGNPGDQNITLKHVSNLDSRKDKLLDGSTFVKIEINDEEIYGSEIEITYALTIKNVSDSNYYEPTDSDKYGYYYKYGEKNNVHVWKIAADEVDDYMDERLEYNKLEHTKYEYGGDERGKGDTYAKSGINSEEIENGEATTITDTGGDKEVKAKTFSIKNWQGLIPEDSLEVQQVSEETKEGNNKHYQVTTKLIANRTLSEFDDMNFLNQAEVIKIHVVQDPPLVEDTPDPDPYFPDPDPDPDNPDEPPFPNPSPVVPLIVVPPTGLNPIIIIGVTVFVVVSAAIATGVILIKKKVL